MHHVGPVGGSPLSDAGHSDAGPPTAICRGGPPNLRARRTGCQPVADLREHANPQVNGPASRKSERPILPSRRVVRRHADGGARWLGTCQSRRPRTQRPRRDHHRAGGAWSPRSARRAPRRRRTPASRPPRATTWTVKSSVRGCGCPTRTSVAGDLEDVAGADGLQELHVGVRREEPLVAVGADADLGGDVAEQAQRVGAVDEVAGVVRVRSTGRSGGARRGAELEVGRRGHQDAFRVDERGATRNDATSPGVVPRVKTRSTPSSTAIASSKRGPPTTSSGRLLGGVGLAERRATSPGC